MKWYSKLLIAGDQQLNKRKRDKWPACDYESSEICRAGITIVKTIKEREQELS
jgi:hypothetical protein